MLIGTTGNHHQVDQPPGGRAGQLAALAGAISAVQAGGAPAGADRRARGRADRRPGGPAPGPQDDPGDPAAVAKSVCLRLLADAARSRYQLEEVLRRRGIPDDVAGRVLDRLTEVGLLDDAAYASAFVLSKQRDRGLGRAALRAELRRKGISAVLAEAAVAVVDVESERERAFSLVAKRLDAAMFAGLPAARRRLLGLLARRGYAASLAASVVDAALRGYCDPVGQMIGTDGDDVSAGWDDVGD